MNVNYDGKKTSEALLTITFLCKQTTMKHGKNRFNLTQFECRIQNLINLLVSSISFIYVHYFFNT